MPSDLSIDALVRWVVEHPELALLIATSVPGLGQVIRTYRRTGRFPLRDLPWRAIRRVYYAFRREYFSHPRPISADLWPVNDDIESFAAALGRQGYEPWRLFSLRYRGEDVNRRTYYEDPDREYPHRQIHIRAWADGDRVLINAHEEPSALAEGHVREHIRSTDMTDCSRWVAMHYDNPNGLDPRSFRNQRQREADRHNPKPHSEP